MNENEKLVEQHKEICNHLNEIYCITLYMVVINT